MYQDSDSSIETELASFPAGHCGDWHDHPHAQLVYPSRGVMVLCSEAGQWVVPPMQAVWLPAHASHRVETSNGFEMISVYITGAWLRKTPPVSGLVAVSPLLRAIILELRNQMPAPRRRRLASLLIGELRELGSPRLQIPALPDRPLSEIGEAFAQDPADARTLEDWARHFGVSSRTLARRFGKEAGISFTAYRRQVRLRAALLKLADGEPVTRVALDLGFGTSSNFSHIFRVATGMTPSAYFRRHGNG